MEEPRVMVTLWPSFSHFSAFAHDQRLMTWGARINSAQLEPDNVVRELKILQKVKPTIPIWFDVKGRQLRIDAVDPRTDRMELILNHPIAVDLSQPVSVLLKQGNVGASLVALGDEGRRLIFDGGFAYDMGWGESIHVCHPSLKVLGPQFTNKEKQRIELMVRAGCKRWCLSFVSSTADVDEFLEIVGKDSQVILKIEDNPGLQYVARQFKKKDNLMLMAAVGDLYVEIGKPSKILPALKLIISKDPQAFRGSRLLLSLSGENVPECSDLVELAWLWDIGYRNFLLCDEICFYQDVLDKAIWALILTLRDYANPKFTI